MGDLDPAVSNGDLYQVVFENDRVRVLEYRDAPGDRTTAHGHPDSVMLTMSSFRRRLVQGENSREVEIPAGVANWLPAQEHGGENIGDTKTHVFFVELGARRRASRRPRLPRPRLPGARLPGAAELGLGDDSSYLRGLGGHRATVGGRGCRLEVEQHRLDAARDLQAVRAVVRDLVEGKVEVVREGPFPGHQPHLPVAVVADGVGIARDDHPTQDVVQLVEDLDGRGRVVDAGGQRLLGDVDEAAYAEGGVLLHRAVVADPQAAVDVGSQSTSVAGPPCTRATGAPST